MHLHLHLARPPPQSSRPRPRSRVSSFEKSVSLRTLLTNCTVDVFLPYLANMPRGGWWSCFGLCVSAPNVNDNDTETEQRHKQQTVQVAQACELCDVPPLTSRSTAATEVKLDAVKTSHTYEDAPSPPSDTASAVTPTTARKSLEMIHSSKKINRALSTSERPTLSASLAESNASCEGPCEEVDSGAVTTSVSNMEEHATQQTEEAALAVAAAVEAEMEETCTPTGDLEEPCTLVCAEVDELTPASQVVGQPTSTSDTPPHSRLPNTTRKYAANARVRGGSTPFEKRLDRVLTSRAGAGG